MFTSASPHSSLLCTANLKNVSRFVLFCFVFVLFCFVFVFLFSFAFSFSSLVLVLLFSTFVLLYLFCLLHIIFPPSFLALFPFIIPMSAAAAVKPSYKGTYPQFLISSSLSFPHLSSPLLSSSLFYLFCLPQILPSYQNQTNILISLPLSVPLSFSPHRLNYPSNS